MKMKNGDAEYSEKNHEIRLYICGQQVVLTADDAANIVFNLESALSDYNHKERNWGEPDPTQR